MIYFIVCFIITLETIRDFRRVRTMNNGTIQYIIMLAAMFGFMYFVMIRPQKKRQKEYQTMIDSLKTGTKVLLKSGFYGKVVKVKGDDFIIELEPDTVKLKVNKYGINSIVEPETKLDKE